MKVVYYTSGVTGSGRLVLGISIGNAFRRQGMQVEFTILSSSPFAHLADIFSFNHLEIPAEGADKLAEKTYHESKLYQAITSLNPDILLIDLLWFPLYHFINDLPCKKIFLCRQVDDRFFSIPLRNNKLVFNPENFDLTFATEPFKGCMNMDLINPIVIKNRDEILSRKEALNRLSLDSKNKTCLLAYNGHPGDFKRIKKTYSYLEDEGYQVVYSTNYEGGIFPVVDYFNAFDLIIFGAGYNSFWEAINFNKEAVFVPTKTMFESGERRVNECQEYTFEENGADQLVDIVMNL